MLAGSTGEARGAGRAEVDAVAGLSDSQRAITDALLDCMRRWGLAKTTMDDVARTAGVSRATVYRLFPGGKSAILDAAARAEARALAEHLRRELDGVEDLTDCLVLGVHTASCVLADNEAVSFLRHSETVAFEQVLSFEHLEGLFEAFVPLFGPSLERFLTPSTARAVTTWLARIVVSYLSTPSSTVDLRDLDQVRALVHGFVLPGISPDDLVHPGAQDARFSPVSVRPTHPSSPATEPDSTGEIR